MHFLILQYFVMSNKSFLNNKTDEKKLKTK